MFHSGKMTKALKSACRRHLHEETSWEASLLLLNQNVTRFSENENRTTIWSNNPASGYIAGGSQVTVLNRHLNSHVHCNRYLNSCVWLECASPLNLKVTVSSQLNTMVLLAVHCIIKSAFSKQVYLWQRRFFKKLKLYCSASPWGQGNDKHCSRLFLTVIKTAVHHFQGNILILLREILLELDFFGLQWESIMTIPSLPRIMCKYKIYFLWTRSLTTLS